jgi:hypothetical protein
MEWRRTKITDEQRKKWRTLRTFVDHFKRAQSSTFPNKDRRTTDQRAIERVRTEGHKAEVALLAKVEEAHQELATRTIESMETFWTVLYQAGPEKFVQALKDHGAKDYAVVHDLLGAWLKVATG